MLGDCDIRHREFLADQVSQEGAVTAANLPCNVTTFGVTTNFEWDEAKNRANIRKHGFDFAWAEQLFRGPLLVRPDTREDYGEERWVGLGMIGGRVAVVTFAALTPDNIRISFRKANHEERKEYEDAIKDGLEAH